jgi:hypothetical protein
MKSTRKTTTKKAARPRRAPARKVSDETGESVITDTRHGSASEEIEAIELAAGEIGTIAHRHFFNIDDMPRFIRDACADAIARACAQLNLPNPDETMDDLVAFQQMIDLFKATGDEFTLAPPRFIQYPPEIEARRADYETLAENLISMIGLSINRVSGTLDVAPPDVMHDEPSGSILIDAIHAHTTALFENINQGLTFEESFLRTLYIELRLYYDHKMDRMSKRIAARAAREGKGE